MDNLLLSLVNDIEKNINFEESLLQIKKLIQLGKINEDDIINAVLTSKVEDKNRVLNDIAVYLFNNGGYDYVIPLLNKSYELNNQHRDTTYNLSYVLYLLGEIDLAMTYLNNLKEKDEDILSLIKEIEKSTKNSEYPNTSIVILTYNNLDYTKLCIESIRKFTPRNTYEIIIVDNNSTDGTVEWLKNQNDIKLILNNENLGFPKGCNQGIEIAQKDNDILLLNNDVIVAPNWLNNLRKCLYSNKNIGAVGPVTNSCSNYQTIPINYTDVNEMINFAQIYNVSDKNKWEERLRLIGYCMLIKREVLDKVGLLDEIFTPGNFEDDDYSLRIRKAGYRLYLCRDTFIHHFGSTSFSQISDKYRELLKTNRSKFINKWGFAPYYIAEIKREVADLILQDKSYDNIDVLHIGCAGGGTLLHIKNKIPSSNLFGIEPIKEAIINTEHFAQIKTGKLGEIKEFKDKLFDYIIITELQDNIDKIIEILRYTKENLKYEGKILIYMNKIRLNKNLLQRLNNEVGNYIYEIKRINNQEIFYMKKNEEKREQKLLEINIYSKNDLDNMNFEIIYNQDSYRNLINIVRRLDNDIDFDNNIEKLKNLIMKSNVDYRKLKEIILNHIINKIKLFNILGIIYYELRLIDESLEILQEAYSIDNNDKDTVYNIAYILHKVGESQLALEFLNNIKAEDDRELLQLKQQIEEEI